MEIPLLAVPPFTDGLPVNAATDNARIGPIVKNIETLAAALRTTLNGSQVLARNVIASENCDARGMAVTWDESLSRFVRAQAIPTKNVLWGTLEFVSPTVVTTGGGNVRAVDVLLEGVQALSVAEQAAVFDPDPPVAGLVYLAATAGKLTTTRPLTRIPVAVGRYANGVLYVHPTFPIEPPFTQRFNLVPEPAGIHTVPAGSDPHVVTSPNVALPGWLPVSVFSVAVPDDTEYGYNLTQDPELEALFANGLLDPANVWFEFDRGTGIGAGVPSELIELTATGIWWKSTCNGQVPWKPTLVTDGTSRPTIPPSTGCPVVPPYRMTLWATRPSLSAVAAVSSIVEGDGIAVNDTTSDVVVAMKVGPTGDRSGLALRSFDGDGVHTGPTVEALRIVGPGVVVTSTGADVPSVPGDSGSPAAKTGTLVVTIAPPTLFQLMPGRIWLNGAGEDRDGGGAYVLFLPVARPSSITARFDVPAIASPSTPATFTMRLSACLRGKVSGNVPVFTVHVRRVPRPEPGAASVDGGALVPAGTTTAALTWTASGHSVTVESPNFSIGANEIVFVTITRSLPDGYAQDVGIYNLFLRFIP